MHLCCIFNDISFSNVLCEINIYCCVFLRIGEATCKCSERVTNKPPQDVIFEYFIQMRFDCINQISAWNNIITSCILLRFRRNVSKMSYNHLKVTSQGWHFHGVPRMSILNTFNKTNLSRNIFFLRAPNVCVKYWKVGYCILFQFWRNGLRRS